MKRQLLHRRVWFVGGGLVGGLLAVFGVSLLVLGSRSDSILPRVQVASVPLGGLSEAAATVLLSTATATSETLAIDVDNSSHDVALADLGVRYDIAATTQAALKLGATNNRLAAGWNRLRGWFHPIQMDPKIDVVDDQFTKATDDFAHKVSQAQKDADLDFSDGAWKVVPSATGHQLDADELRTTILAHLAQMNSQPIHIQTAVTEPHITTAQAEQLLELAKDRTGQPIELIADDEKTDLSVAQLTSWTGLTANQDDQSVDVQLDETKVKAFLKSLAAKIDREPVDARVTITDGKVQVLQDSQRGRRLDQSKSLEMIVTAFANLDDRTLTLPVTMKDPDVAAPTIESLGIQELIGRATTSYIGSPDNRKHNIANGAQFLAGKLVKPGDQFSVVTALGAVDDTTGYLPELVIKENKTTPEFGGGLCQVSTTLFRAALNAGLKITERANHSYRVPYYERGVGPGLDATIYLPKPDLKFLNDTPGWILIQSINNPAKNEITFELYGTKDGRTSEVSKPNVYNITDPPPAIYVDAPDLPVGKTKQVEKAHAGATTDVTYKVFRSGKLINEQHFHSVYKPWAPRFLVGTGSVASPAPDGVSSPTPSPTDSTTPSPSPSASATNSPSPSPSATQTTPAP